MLDTLNTNIKRSKNIFNDLSLRSFTLNLIYFIEKNYQLQDDVLLRSIKVHNECL